MKKQLKMFLKLFYKFYRLEQQKNYYLGGDYYELWKIQQV